MSSDNGNIPVFAGADRDSITRFAGTRLIASKENSVERDPDRNPETRADLNEAPQEELPPGAPLSPTGTEATPATTQPVASRAEEVATVQAPRRGAFRLPGAPVADDPEQFLGMLVTCDLRDREGHRLLAVGETVTAPALAEIEAAGCLEELARIVRPPIAPVAPLGME